LETLGILKARPVNPLKTLGKIGVWRLGNGENLGVFEGQSADATREEGVIANINRYA
jgi:hypothetical protein